MSEIVINSTIDQLEDFKSSVIWNDISHELQMWKVGFEMERSGMVDEAAETNPSTASFLLHTGDLHGRIKAVDYFLSVIDVFIDTKKSEIEAKKLESEDSED